MMKSLVYLFASLWMIVSIVACQKVNPLPATSTVPSAAEALPFATLELGQPVIDKESWTDPAPGLLVIATAEDIAAAARYVSDEAVLQLEDMDFTQELALLVFYGWEPTLRYDFAVSKVVREQTQISVIAEPGRISGEDAESSSYHLIKLRKIGVWDETLVFALYFGDTQPAVVTVAKFIP